MEFIVIFNAGKDAAAAGAERRAPDLIPYPGHGSLPLSEPGKTEWLRGFDHMAARREAARGLDFTDRRSARARRRVARAGRNA